MTHFRKVPKVLTNLPLMCTQSDLLISDNSMFPALCFRLQFVEGFATEGHSIDVFVNLERMSQPQALAELVAATGELPTLFNVKSHVFVDV